MKILKGLALRYPQESILLLFNLGVFTWMRLSLSQVLDRLGPTGGYQRLVPDWLQELTGHNLESFQSFFETSSWAWLVTVLVLVFVWRLLTRLLRTICFLLILGGGLWLIWQNQHILSQFVR